jgi:hypothetical protein
MDIVPWGLDFIFQLGRRMHKFLIAISTFNESSVMRDHQPNAGVAQGPFRAITGNFPSGNDFGFWGIVRHFDRSLLVWRSLYL